MPATFKINTLPTAVLLTPNDANGRLAHMIYTPGAGWASPRMTVAWSFASGDSGQTQTQYELEIATSTTPTASGGAPSSTVVSGAVSSAATSVTPAPSAAFVEGNYYFVRVRVNDGLEWSAWSGWFECRVRWGLSTHRKDVNIAGSAPTTWTVSGLNTTVGASSTISMEYNSSDDGTTNLGSWKSDLSQVTKRKFVHYRAWFFAWGTSPATRPQLLDITIQTTGYLLQPDFWLPSPISGEGGLIEVGTFAFGGQSLRMTGDGTEQVVRQQVRVEPNTDYMLQGRMLSLGNSGARVQLADTETGAAIHSTDALTADVSPFALKIAIPWNSGNRTAVWIQCRVNGSSSTSGWFDGVKLEKGLVASAWGPAPIGMVPGLTGSASVVDAGGVQVDALMGGIFRLRGAAGGARDVVELGNNGLKFGGDVEVSSPAAGELKLLQTAGQDKALTVETASAKLASIRAQVAGDTVARATLRGDATFTGLQFGPGNAAADTNLYRDAANSLKSDDDFNAAGLAIAGNALGYFVNMQQLIYNGSTAASPWATLAPEATAVPANLATALLVVFYAYASLTTGSPVIWVSDFADASTNWQRQYITGTGTVGMAGGPAIVVPGGTNGRQFHVGFGNTTSSPTFTFYVDVVGYWHQ